LRTYGTIISNIANLISTTYKHITIKTRERASTYTKYVTGEHNK